MSKVAIYKGDGEEWIRARHSETKGLMLELDVMYGYGSKLIYVPVLCLLGSNQ